jgi:hypothetical protein
MTVTLLALLNDVHDAEYVLLHSETYSTALLLSTHESVNDYLSARGRTCVSLSSFLEIDELSDFYRQSECIYSFLDGLDRQFGDLLFEAIRSPRDVRYFYSLYRYLGRYEYTNILKIRLGIERVLEKHPADTAHLFLPHASESAFSFFSTTRNVYKAVLEDKRLIVKEINSPLAASVQRKIKRDVRKGSIDRALWFLTHKLIGAITRLAQKDAKKESRPGAPILVESKYANLPGGQKELMLLLDGPSTTRSYPGLASHLDETTDYFNDSSIDLADMDFLLTKMRQELETASALHKPFDPLAFLRLVFLDDFISRFHFYTMPLRKLIQLDPKYHIAGGVWNWPPSKPSPKILLIAYLLQAGVPVLGAQHGGNYGVQNIYPRHFDSDFWWCTHYFSWGFAQADLKETYPHAKPRCEIFPLGRKQHDSINRDGELGGIHKKKRVDILFPITNASYFHRDTLRIPQHLLAQYQRELLLFLDGLKDLTVVVKPFRGFGYKNSAFVELLGGLRHVKVENHLGLSECFETHQVRSVLIEYPSSPMFEAMCEDAEVFVLTNPIIKYSPAAEAQIKRRVHLHHDPAQLKTALTDYLSNEVANKRRDSVFTRQYFRSADVEAYEDALNRIFKGAQNG